VPGIKHLCEGQWAPGLVVTDILLVFVKEWRVRSIPVKQVLVPPHGVGPAQGASPIGYVVFVAIHDQHWDKLSIQKTAQFP